MRPIENDNTYELTGEEFKSLTDHLLEQDTRLTFLKYAIEGIAENEQYRSGDKCIAEDMVPLVAQYVSDILSYGYSFMNELDKHLRPVGEPRGGQQGEGG